jgi:hypothetical protein
MSAPTCEVLSDYGTYLEICASPAAVVESSACVHEHLRRTRCCQFHAHPKKTRVLCRPCLLADGHECDLRLLKVEPLLAVADA